MVAMVTEPVAAPAHLFFLGWTSTDWFVLDSGIEPPGSGVTSWGGEDQGPAAVWGPVGSDVVPSSSTPARV